MKKECGNCRSFVPLSNDDGECRFLPPAPVAIPAMSVQGPGVKLNWYFPKLRSELYCTQFEPKADEPTHTP